MQLSYLQSILFTIIIRILLALCLQSPQVAMTKYYKLGGLKITLLFLIVMGAGNVKLMAQRIQCLVRNYFLDHSWWPFAVSSVVNDVGSSVGFLLQGH